MSGPAITAVVTLLTGLAGFVTFLVNRRDKNKDPIPKQEAQLAMAERALGIIEKSRDTLGKDVERIGAELEAERARSNTQQAQINELKSAVAKIEGTLTAALRYIETLRRAWVAIQGAPPPPALPIPLRDLVDPSVHGEEA